MTDIKCVHEVHLERSIRLTATISADIRGVAVAIARAHFAALNFTSAAILALTLS
jgi:hypothetical protein